MDQPISEFIRVRTRLIEVLKQYPADMAEEILFGEWSLKSVVSHLAGWDRYFTGILKDLEAGKQAPYWDSIQKFNEGSVGERMDLGWKEVYEESVAAGDDFVQAYSQVPSDMIDQRFWPKRAYTPDEILHVNIHHYAESHLPEIEGVLVLLEGESADEQSSSA